MYDDYILRYSEDFVNEHNENNRHNLTQHHIDARRSLLRRNWKKNRRETGIARQLLYVGRGA